MKYLYFFVWLFLLAGCTVEQPKYETDVINGICFYGLDKTKTNLTDQFRRALLTGSKSSILNEAMSLSDAHCWKSCIRELDKKGTTKICDIDFPQTLVTLKVEVDDSQYLGAHLNMYFDGENLNAAILSLIYQK